MLLTDLRSSTLKPLRECRAVAPFPEATTGVASVEFSIVAGLLLIQLILTWA